jgi:uncharacterized C2H2 Zn-finger protein
MSWIESVLHYSKQELELIGFDKSDLGEVVIDTINKLHGSVGNQPTAIKSILKMMSDLVDKKPISVITERDFDEDGRCTRCDYIYRAKDGKYYNDRAVVFKRSWEDPSEQYVYQGQNRSKKEITLPCILRQEVVLVP